jgi:carboxypeptidase Q
MLRILFFCLVLLNGNFLKAQVNQDSNVIKQIMDFTLTKGKAYDNLYVLCKQIGKRLSGSPAMYKAETWGLKAMQDAKADNAFLQECLVPHWVRNATEKVTYNAGSGEKVLNVLALGNSIGSNNKIIKADVIQVNNFEELNAKKESIKGKIVFFNYPFNQTFIRTFMGYGDAVRYRSGGASMAAKYGAVGALVRSVSSSPDNNPHTGALRYNDSFPKLPAFAVGVQDADLLAKAIAKNKVKISMQNNANFLPDTVGHNVVGEIKGSEFPNQIITVGGHLDSWDLGEGAHDDGAGMVQSIEVINILKSIGYQPKHTIRAVLFANEENGGKGGAKYAELAQTNKEEHIAAIESDAGGFSPRAFGGTMNDAQYTKFKSWLPLLINYGITEMNRGGGGADIAPLGTKFKTPTIGLIPDSQRYFDLHHSKNDVFEAVSKRELHLGAGAMAALVYLIDQYGL